jgi:hypothetical protein
VTGFIYSEDMKTPVENAVVKIRNVKDRREFNSFPTDKTGVYRIANVDEGQYILGVSTQSGDFNFDYQITVKANEVGKLSLALKPGSPSTPGQGQQQQGQKKGFFLTPGGIVVIVAAAIMLGIGIYELTKSPSKK